MISPTYGPEFTAIPIAVHGKGFSTSPEATTISFGSRPGTHVSCSSTILCTVTTPEGFTFEPPYETWLSEGTYRVTATVGGVTSTGPNVVIYTARTYAPPTESIVLSTKGVPQFHGAKLVTAYAAIFTPGNVYFDIYNSTPDEVTIEGGPVSPETLGAGQTLGENVPVNEAEPKIFTIPGSPHGTLTVVTKTPK